MDNDPISEVERENVEAALASREKEWDEEDEVEEEEEDGGIPLFTKVPTQDPTLWRFVDMDGEWESYWSDKYSRLLPSLTSILRRAYPKGEGLLRWLKRTTEAEADEKFFKASERGSRVHQAIRLLSLGQKVRWADRFNNSLTGRDEALTLDEYKCLLAWAQWAKDFNYRPLLVEHSVEKDGEWAGTMDSLCLIDIKEKKTRTVPNVLVADKKRYEKITKDVGGSDFVSFEDWVTLEVASGRIKTKEAKYEEVSTIMAVLDWKTSKYLHDEHRLQVCALSEAIREHASKIAEKVGYSGKLHAALLRVGTDHKNGPLSGAGYEFDYVGAIEDDEKNCAPYYALWRNTLSTFKLAFGNTEPSDKDVKVPSSIEFPSQKVDGWEVSTQ